MARSLPTRSRTSDASIASRTSSDVHAQLTKDDIFSLIDAFRTIDPDDTSSLDTEIFPTASGPKQGTQDLLYPDPVADAPLLTRLRDFGTTPATGIVASDVKVSVLNASGRNGTTQGTLAAFQAAGFVAPSTAHATAPVARSPTRGSARHPAQPRREGSSTAT